MNYSALSSKESSKEVGARYRHIDSENILGVFRDHGFNFDQYSEANPRKLERRGYQRHLMKFTRDDLNTGNGEKLELLVTNSHDGTSSLRFDVGVFRFACANGLVVGDTAFSERIRHVGDVESKISETIESMVKRLPLVAARIEKYKGINIDNDVVISMLGESLKLRGIDATASVYVPGPRRQEDKGSDLWTFYNILQESLIKGGLYIHTPEQPRGRKLRALKSNKSIIEVNKGLWNITERIAV